MGTSVEIFNEHYPLLFSIAYRMLGSVMEAEDMAQETFIRWQSVETAQVDTPKAYLTTVITRLCLDQLRSARVQRETYIGPWLPEPLLTEDQPNGADRAVLADSLSMAFLVLLERLSPTERAVFLLREVFDYGYAEISEIVGKSEVNCRQMARRARQHLADQRPRFESSPEAHSHLLTQFMETCLEGDLPGLVNLLTDDITLWSDGGGKAHAARRPIYGADNVARFLLGITKKAPAGMVVRLTQVNHQPALIIYRNDQPIVVMLFDIVAEKFQAIRSVLNPDKLQSIPPLAADQEQLSIDKAKKSF